MSERQSRSADFLAASEASRFEVLVSKESRFASLFKPGAKRGYSLDRKAGRLTYNGQAKRDALLTLLGLFAVLMSLQPAFAGLTSGPLNEPISRASPASPFVTVSHLGELEQQEALRDGQLLSHRRALDPFGFTIRGPFKGLPPMVEHPAATPGQPAAVNQDAAAVNVPTLEKAVQELAIGAVNVGSHEILIGSRSIHEGDLLVLASGGRQFVVWVQSIGVRGVLFCDTDLKKHLLKRFGSGPEELPGDSVRGTSDVRNFLKSP